MLHTLSPVHSKFSVIVCNFLKNCCSIYVSGEWVLILELSRWFSRRKLVCPGEILVIGRKEEVFSFLCLLSYLSGFSSFVPIVKHSRMTENENILRESAQQTCQNLFDSIVAEYVTSQGKLFVTVGSTDMDGCRTLQAQTGKASTMVFVAAIGFGSGNSHGPLSFTRAGRFDQWFRATPKWKRLTREGKTKVQHNVSKSIINDVLQPGQQIEDEGDKDPKFAYVLHSKKGIGCGSSSSGKSKNNDEINLEACSIVDLEKIAPAPNLPLPQNQDCMDNYKKYPSSQSQVPFPIKENDKGSNFPSNHTGITIGNQLVHERDKASYSSFVSLHNQTPSTLKAISKGSSPQGYQKKERYREPAIGWIARFGIIIAKKWNSYVMKDVLFSAKKKRRLQSLKS
ncbi:hypothetical protein V6N12_050273 [Hibiscus sabdariffa]|uniref:Uncharacterized protein n=1 Tax=Hibiscus sabdariffa TaxID=183260 RepID=A0ABR2GBY8_9ROSI